MTVIVLNSIQIALDGEDLQEGVQVFLETINTYFIWIYTVEMLLKIFAMGLIFGEGAYLKDSWNKMDFVIVVSALYEEYEKQRKANLPPQTTTNKEGVKVIVEEEETEDSTLTVLRSFRILRPLKTIAKNKDLKVIMGAIFSSIPMLMNIIIVLAFFILVMAIAGIQLFSGQLLKKCFLVSTGQFMPDKFCATTTECMKISGDGAAFDN